MNPQLVGEPAVAAFFRSVLRNLGGIRLMKPNYSTYLFYDPTQDLETLKQKLVFFQGLVMDGEAKRLDDPAVDEWMDELKDLLYDVEDIFDDIRSLWKDEVSNNFPLFEQFSRDIKDRFNQILARTKKLGEDAETLKLERGRKHAFWGDQWKLTLRSRETSSTVDISEIHGREEDKDVIVKRLLQVDLKRKKKYDVVCIVGMGGIGKTILAQLVFSDPEVEKHFDMKSWVCISNVFDVSKATKDLIKNSDDNGNQVDQLTFDGLQRRLSMMVEKKKFLFVLDDVWSSSEWETMKRPFSKCANGSKILLTTRNIKIAQTLGDKNPYQLRELNHEKCMEIFRDRAFGDDDEDEDIEETFDLAEKIVRACGGVPLVIKVIGSMLQGADVEKWRAVSENTATWANTNDEILPAIRLSYYDLPASLKRCFEYLALFPPDYEFDQDFVVELWIADGLVEEGEGRRVEDIGNEYYNELKARSLIQENHMMHDIVHHLATVLSKNFCYKENSKESPASLRHAYLHELNAMHYEFPSKAPCLRTLYVNKIEDENVFGNTIKSCKMIRTLITIELNLQLESSLREYLKDHPTHIRFLAIQGSYISQVPVSLVLDNLQFLYLDNLPEGMNHFPNLRHLIIYDSDISSLPQSICHLSQLQVLKVTCCRHLEQFPKDIGNLRSLWKLDLRETFIDNLPESICALDRLQVLNLQYCRCLTQLPKDIGNLRSLQKLDLRETSISSLPKSILNITGLQNILYDSEKPFPLHIGSVAEFNELFSYHVGKEEERHLGESTKLNIMNMLGGHLAFAMDNDGSIEVAKMADLKSRKSIRGLAFRWNQPGNDEELEVNIMEALEPHPALESLEICNYGGDKLPVWIMSTNICWSNLVQLKMVGLNKVCEMIEMEFVSLRYLWIKNCPKLGKVLMATPKLEILSIKNCGELEADCLCFPPSLSDKDDLLSIISQLEKLKCPYNIFEYWFDKLKTANSKWEMLESITLTGGGIRFASLPRGWRIMLESLEHVRICDIESGKKWSYRIFKDGTAEGELDQ